MFSQDDVPPFLVNPADFGPDVDISLSSQLKIGVIDSGCSETPTLPNIECFGRKPIFKSIHSCESPAMISAHGFACASIIGGRSRNIDFFGVCDKEIHGVLPDVQVYAYGVGCKNCPVTVSGTCVAIDEAIKDGVKVISLSQGPVDPKQVTCPQDDKVGKKLLEAYDEHMVSCVASGNDGPLEGTITNAMPWVINVGACTGGQVLVTDIEIAVKANAKIPPGVDILERTHDAKGKFMIIDRIQGVSLNVINSNFRKLRISKSSEDKECIMTGTNSSEYIYVAHARINYRSVIVSPVVTANFWASVCKEDCNKMWSWQAKFGIQQLYVRMSVSKYQNDERGVFVAHFSSRGPSKAYQNNIAPDVVAPGFSVLVSHLNQFPLNKECERDPLIEKLFKDHKIVSGTSFACPLVAAYALIVCSYYPHWNPSAVKSALITTAFSFQARGIPGNEFAFGAGAVDLESALDPGLIYEESGKNFQRYVDGKLEIFDLNLPTFAASFPHSHRCCERKFSRELKNVGKGDGAYKFEVEYLNKAESGNVKITAEPAYLEFKAGEKQKFILKVKICPRPNAYVNAIIKWVPTTAGRCCVNSPLILYHLSEFDRTITYMIES